MYSLGAVLIIVGLVLRLFAIKTLKTQFTFVLQKQEWICNRGVYRVMRHPSYLGSLLMLLGASLISPVLGILWLGVMFFISRIAEEENKLDSPEYSKYKKQVGMFWPHIK